MSKPTGSIEFCRRALEQREAFWAEQAQAIHWEKPFQKVCDPEYLRKYDTRSLQRLYLAGEPLDEPTWAWIGGALEIPILDNY